jgi:tRNA 5-methylaminomethyl-2-thiouridine biosynthesis bifunctional protein
LPLDPAGLDWTPQGAPRSQRFGDIYFSREGGLDETRAVFLEGCGLPQAYADRAHFTVGELGFGTGLNILALLDLWRRTRAPGQTLSIFSVEGFPLSRAEAERALSAWPELADLSQSLLNAWPRMARGFHRLTWPEIGATLDLAIGDVEWALCQWSGAADAWFLDGFSPALNPEMWSQAVLSAVAARSAPGARLATFTVAGAVRRGLQTAGFIVGKRPGHGAKRERLEAVFPGEARDPISARSVAVIGAGIAGAALTRVLSARGLQVTVIEARAAGSGASGNPAALVTPALDAGGGVRALFYAQAFARAVDLYDEIGAAAVAGRGVLQLEQTERDAARFDSVFAGDVFAPGALERQPNALRFTQGLVIRPAAVLDAWLRGAHRLEASVAALERRGAGWALLDNEGREIVQADAVCIAAGAQAHDLLAGALPLAPVRGQVSWVQGLDLETAAAWGGYAAPIDGAVLFGATHDRGRTDTDVDLADHVRNLQTLALALPDLAQAADGLLIQGRAAIRATTHDRSPVAGILEAGLYVLGGLGSRGFTTAPLLAEHISSLIAETPSPLPLDMQAMVSPARLHKQSRR